MKWVSVIAPTQEQNWELIIFVLAPIVEYIHMYFHNMQTCMCYKVDKTIKDDFPPFYSH